MIAAVSAATVVAGPAQARTSVSVGIGVGPIFPAYGYYHPHRYYAPPYRYYAPPPVVQYYAPPPVVYAPPPVVYAPAPAPMAVDPAGPAYYSRNGQQCREYQSSAVVGGRSQPVYGTACLQSDGTWRIVN
ncbi:hypothetical protein ABMY26_33055 [Azospirillum sp. HJ39]